MLRRISRLSLLLIGLLVGPARAQTTISGRVVNLDGGNPLPDVRVALCAAEPAGRTTRRVTWTDDRGWYTLADVPPGSWCVQAVAVEADIGYVLKSPPLAVATTPRLLHFGMPTGLRERLANTRAPTDPNPKSLSVITGYLEDGYAADAWGTALAGSLTHFETYDTGLLRGRVVRNDVPVADAHVLIPTSGQHTRTDAEGRFELTDLAPGSPSLFVIHDADTLALPAVTIIRGLNLLTVSFRKDLRNE